MRHLNGPPIAVLLLGASACLLVHVQFVRADFVFGEPTPVPSLNSASADWKPSITADGLNLYFASNRDHGANFCYHDIWVATRATKDEPWGSPRNLGPPVNTSYPDAHPSVSADGLELYFSDVWSALTSGCDSRPGGYGRGDLWVSKRTTREADWGPPINLGPEVNSSDFDGIPHISADGLSLYFSSERAAGLGFDLYVTMRATKDDPWGPPADLGAGVNTGAGEYVMYPFVSPDGLSLFFTGTRSSEGRGDIFMSTRSSTTDSWGWPSRFAALNSSRNDEGLTFSVGDSTLYFVRSNPYNLNPQNPALGSFDLWQVEVSPIVDLNGDGMVDCADVCILVDHWHTGESLCDIAPLPLGDGFVDVQDLVVLSEHLFEDNRLVAHWKLDEIEGSIANDSAGDRDGILNGGPHWQPTTGKTDGSLQLDGTDDYVSTPFLLDPAAGSFSVTSWIKGGVSGQIIISQADTPGNRGTIPGSTWLGINSSDGKLTTNLMHPPFDPLVSESVITDDQWHHVGLVYDFIGLHRYLYVDGVEVAKDADFVGGAASDSGLYFGAGADLDAATFFSGLIDDVRIYEVALTPEEIAGLAQ